MVSKKLAQRDAINKSSKDAHTDLKLSKLMEKVIIVVHSEMERKDLTAVLS